MARISKNIAFTAPPAIVDEFEQIAKEEQSTKSELFRRMFRFYASMRKQPKQQTQQTRSKPNIDTDFDAWVDFVIFEAMEEEKTNPMSDAEFKSEMVRSVAYGAERATAAGITTEEQINDIIHEERQKRRQAVRCS